VLKQRWLKHSTRSPWFFHRPLSVVHGEISRGQRGVSEGGIKLWRASMHGKLLGMGRSPQAAAWMVCRMAGGKSIEELAIPASVRCPRSVARYEGVWWRKPGAKSLGGWWVNKKAIFKDQRAAVAFAAKQRGLTAEKLRRPVAPQELCGRIGALSCVLDVVPFDIEDLVTRAADADQMSSRVPVLMPLFIQAKLGPWRGLMQEAWKALVADPRCPVHHCRGRSLPQAVEADVARTILVRAVRGMARTRSVRAELQYWNELNLGVQHHAGFVAMCLRLNVIETGGHLDLGTQGSKYKLLDDCSQTLKKLEKMSAAWRDLSSVLCVPTTCSKWRQCMLDAMKLMYEKHAPGLNPKNGVYLPGWTLRCYLFMTVRKEGVKSMKWKDIGIRALGQMNPDQKQWFSTLEQRIKTTAHLRALVGTSCPPELLSCQLCLLSHKCFDMYDSEWILKVRPFIRVVAAVGARLRKGVRMPTLDVLKETSRLLRD